MKLALIHEVFPGAGGEERLRRRLREARDAGAEIAALPELPLDPWIPATRTVRDADAEETGGPRQRLMAAAARAAGIALVGGAIVREAGRRLNRAFVFDSDGLPVAQFDKLHLPSEEGFWEADHYETGDRPARPVDGFSMRLGLQICSDLNRPAGCQQLGASGAQVIVAPRATPPASYERWKLVIRANALTGGTFVVSVNRPGPEPGSDVGGPSIVAAPDGSVLAETTEPVSVVELCPGLAERARRDYPGYLEVRPTIYARGWADVSDEPR